jgi:XTP/dITP diphosphohydrolase
MKLVFATHNLHKLQEIRAAIGDAFEVIGLDEAGIYTEIPEPYDTLEENASEKTRVISRLTGSYCFSEDTGLEVEALKGEPGVRSARYAGVSASADQNIEKLLGKMGQRPDRNARFRTVISLRWNDGEHFFEGVCEGRILFAREGQGGFGYDPVFVPEGSEISFAEMNMDEKNRFSHRRKAADKLIAFLRAEALQFISW